MAARTADAYLKTQILTAPPEKLQLMLYDGAIRFAMQARSHLETCQYDLSYEFLIKAQNIMLELICGLRPDADADLCRNMASLYSFVYRRLVEANVRRETSAVDDALKILELLRDMWLDLLERLADERSESEALEASVNAEV